MEVLSPLTIKVSVSCICASFLRMIPNAASV